MDVALVNGYVPLVNGYINIQTRPGYSWMFIDIYINPSYPYGPNSQMYSAYEKRVCVHSFDTYHSYWSYLAYYVYPASSHIMPITA